MLNSAAPGIAALIPSMERPQHEVLRNRANSEGEDYRLDLYEGQWKAGAAKPQISTPSIEAVRLALRAHSPRSVLEIGCGWGLITEELVDEFDVNGCDISEDMLKPCPDHIRVFQQGAVVQNRYFLQAHQNPWDVIFTLGAMTSLMEKPLRMAYAMNNMLMLAGKKIIVFEYRKVCDRMREFSSSRKFEYRPIEQRSE